MSWIKKASVGEVNYESEGRIVVWVTGEEVEDNQTFIYFKNRYQIELDRIKSTDLNPKQKVSELKSIRQELMDQLKERGNDITSAIAGQKLADAMTLGEASGVNIDADLGSLHGSIAWEILYGGRKPEEDLELAEDVE